MSLSPLPAAEVEDPDWNVEEVAESDDTKAGEEEEGMRGRNPEQKRITAAAAHQGAADGMTEDNEEDAECWNVDPSLLEFVETLSKKRTRFGSIALRPFEPDGDMTRSTADLRSKKKTKVSDNHLKDVLHTALLAIVELNDRIEALEKALEAKNKELASANAKGKDGKGSASSSQPAATAAKGSKKEKGCSKGAAVESACAMPAVAPPPRHFGGCQKCGWTCWETDCYTDKAYYASFEWLWHNEDKAKVQVAACMKSLNSGYLLGWTKEDASLVQRRLALDLNRIHFPNGWLCLQWKAHKFLQLGCSDCGGLSVLELPSEDTESRTVAEKNCNHIIAWIQSAVGLRLEWYEKLG